MPKYTPITSTGMFWSAAFPALIPISLNAMATVSKLRVCVTHMPWLGSCGLKPSACPYLNSTTPVDGLPGITLSTLSFSTIKWPSLKASMNGVTNTQISSLAAGHPNLIFSRDSYCAASTLINPCRSWPFKTSQERLECNRDPCQTPIPSEVAINRAHADLAMRRWLFSCQTYHSKRNNAYAISMSALATPHQTAMAL